MVLYYDNQARKDCCVASSAVCAAAGAALHACAPRMSEPTKKSEEEVLLWQLLALVASAAHMCCATRQRRPQTRRRTRARLGNGVACHTPLCCRSKGRKSLWRRLLPARSPVLRARRSVLFLVRCSAAYKRGLASLLAQAQRAKLVAGSIASQQGGRTADSKESTAPHRAKCGDTGRGTRRRSAPERRARRPSCATRASCRRADSGPRTSGFTDLVTRAMVYPTTAKPASSGL